MFDQTQANLAPWMKAGQNALTNLQNFVGTGAPAGSTLPAGTTANAPVGAPAGGSLYWTDPATGAGYMMRADGTWTDYNGAVVPLSQVPQLAQAAGQPTPALSPENLNKYIGANFQTSPGYNFQMQQGANAILNNASATGGVGGNTLKALTQFGQGVANQDYWNFANNFTNNYWNQYNAGVQGKNTMYNMLTGLSNTGENAAANVGSMATQVGNQIGNNMIAAGNAHAAGIVGGANAINGAIGGLGNIGQNYLLYNALMNSGGGATASGGGDTVIGAYGAS